MTPATPAPLVLSVLVSASLLSASSGLQEEERWKAIELFEVREATSIADDRLAAAFDRATPVTEADPPLDDLGAYRAVILDPRRRQEVEVNLFVLPLAAPLAGGQLAVAVDDGSDIRAIDAFGHPDLSKSDFSVWFTFLLQFLANPSMGTEEFRQAKALEGVDRPATLQGFLAGAASDERRRLAFLAEQRHLMKSNRLLLFHLQQVLRSAQSVEPSWFEAQRRLVTELQEQIAVLGDVLGDDELAQYRASLAALADEFGGLASDAESGGLTMETLPTRARELSRRCSDCHDAPSPQADRSLQEFVVQTREASKLPRGVLQIGYDVALAPGQDAAAGVSVTAALHLALRLHAEL